MSKEDIIESTGVIEECLPGALFRVKLENGPVVIGHISGRMRKNRIQILMGDRVRVELSVYDLGKCRISYREK